MVSDMNNKKRMTGYSDSLRNGLLASFAVLGIALFSPVAYSACQPYLVESNNGDGGFRFMHDVKNFRAVNTGTRYEAVICDRRSFRIELAKRNPGARVNFSIDGKRYVFAEGSEGDKFVNNWYRKYIDIKF